MVLESGGELKLNGATIKLDAGAELSVSATGAIRISSGGSFDVDTPNFKISSDNKTMEVGSWKWEQDRLTFDKESSGDKIVFGDDDIYDEKNRLVISPTNRGMRIMPRLPEDEILFPSYMKRCGCCSIRTYRGLWLSWNRERTMERRTHPNALW